MVVVQAAQMALTLDVHLIVGRETALRMRWGEENEERHRANSSMFAFFFLTFVRTQRHSDKIKKVQV